MCLYRHSFARENSLYYQVDPFTTPLLVADNRGVPYVMNGIADWLYEGELPFIHLESTIIRWGN